ncbi:hypothetical protein ACNM7U_07510 [Aerococcus viridans]
MHKFPVNFEFTQTISQFYRNQHGRDIQYYCEENVLYEALIELGDEMAPVAKLHGATTGK